MSHAALTPDDLWVGRIIEHSESGTQARIESYTKRGNPFVYIKTGPHAGEALALPIDLVLTHWKVLD